MRRCRATARGFTLVELLFAMAIGVVVVGAAFAALRLAAQSVAISNRLSIENSCLRAGFQAANAEVDFWTGVDDPDAASPTKRPLRAYETTEPDPAWRLGLPFTPMSAIDPAPAVAPADREYATGWDGDPRSWSPHDPRTWWRGNKVEGWFHQPTTLGRYAIFANATAADDPSRRVDIAGYGTVTVPHAWAYAQIRELTRALGYYGACEYLPANTIYGWYERFDGDEPAPGTPPSKIKRTSEAGVPLRMTANAVDMVNGYRWAKYTWPAESDWFNNADWDSKNVVGLMKLTNMTCFGVARGADGDPTASLIAANRRSFRIGFGSVWKADAELQMRDFATMLEIGGDLLPLRPTHWPELRVSVQRYLKNCRPYSLCRVRVVSPDTGVASELNFTTFGTTLRGARQQRRDGGGWARWNDDGGADDRTLDAP